MTLKPATRYGCLVRVYTKTEGAKHAQVSLHGVISTMAHSKDLAKAAIQEEANTRYGNREGVKKVVISKPEKVNEKGELI